VCIYTCIYIYTYVKLKRAMWEHMGWQQCVDSLYCYGVATSSRLLKIIGLFCKRALWKRYILQKRPMILRSLLIVDTHMSLFKIFSRRSLFCRALLHKSHDIYWYYVEMILKRDIWGGKEPYKTGIISIAFAFAQEPWYLLNLSIVATPCVATKQHTYIILTCIHTYTHANIHTNMHI